MAGRGDPEPPGSLSLLRFVEEHEEAVEFDLIALGLRLRELGGPRLTLRDLWIIVRRNGRTPGTEIYGSEFGIEENRWGLTEHLLAHVFDALQTQVWMKTKDGQKGRNPPKPFPRPGVEDKNSKSYGSGALPIEELDAFLAGEFRDLDAQQLGEGTVIESLSRADRDEAIRAAAAAGTPRAEIAAQWDVSVSTVGRVIRAQ